LLNDYHAASAISLQCKSAIFYIKLLIDAISHVDQCLLEIGKHPLHENSIEIKVITSIDTSSELLSKRKKLLLMDCLMLP
jgi:hypothetical protein